MAQSSTSTQPLPYNTSPSSVVTRFAPSPTGYLHIGGARTALFNWLYAKHHGGSFLLRIEDTDRARHNEAAVDAILDGLAWLGMEPDTPPISQYEQRDRHREVAQSLLENGHAYRCYLTPEELENRRNQAMAEKVRFESPWRDRDPGDAPVDAAFSIRLKMPQDGETIIKDAVQGHVSIPNHALDDLIIQRSGTDGQTGDATYNLAVVCDDHDMGVTHVIRGDDHLINAARQTHIYKAMDWDVPVFAHIPLIHGPDGKKLSKRHGALGVEAYRDMGYLADGLCNYLLRLGWAHENEEIIPMDRAIKLFDLSGINKGPARLDPDKLDHINAHYLHALNSNEFAKAAMAYFEEHQRPLTDIEKDRITRAAPTTQGRIAHFGAFESDITYMLTKRPLEISGKAAKPLKKEGAGAHLQAVAEYLERQAIWSSPDEIDHFLQELAEQRGVGFGQIGPPLRAALTGGLPAPNLGAVIFALGKNEALGRVQDCLANLEQA